MERLTGTAGVYRWFSAIRSAFEPQATRGYTLSLPNLLLIPAFRPGPELPKVIDAAGVRFGAVLVVDDGSGPEFEPVFRACHARILRHEKNLGKGAALRSGIACAIAEHPGWGVVTADADGQHHPDDIARVGERLAREPDSMVMGARGFDGDVPPRSRVGNFLSRLVFRMLIGHKLGDTQSGLRGIPAHLLPELARIKSSGYEFEIDMLTAAKHLSVPIVEEPIRTIYAPGNPSSHFNPLRDSMRIGFVLARFSILSLATAALDNVVFSLAIGEGAGAGAAQIVARAVAVCVNYPLARRAVFLSREPHRSTLLRYLVLVIASGVLSFQLLRILQAAFGWSVLEAKIAAESSLFIVNFLVQRDWVFLRRHSGIATDWDQYYSAPAPTTHITRPYTARTLVKCMRRFAGKVDRLVEFGGANSCLFDRIMREIGPREYHVVDTNAYGLSLLAGRGVVAHQRDCREPPEMRADLAFSVGLIEHFDRAGTREAIAAHFRALKPGGWALITFPTPTWLYRAARWVTEASGQWKFPDERPLKREEVLADASDWGEVQFEKILWPLIFTQRMMVFRKK